MDTDEKHVTYSQAYNKDDWELYTSNKCEAMRHNFENRDRVNGRSEQKAISDPKTFATILIYHNNMDMLNPYLLYAASLGVNRQDPTTHGEQQLWSKAKEDLDALITQGNMVVEEIVMAACRKPCLTEKNGPNRCGLFFATNGGATKGNGLIFVPSRDTIYYAHVGSDDQLKENIRGGYIQRAKNNQRTKAVNKEKEKEISEKGFFIVDRIEKIKLKINSLSQSHAQILEAKTEIEKLDSEVKSLVLPRNDKKAWREAKQELEELVKSKIDRLSNATSSTSTGSTNQTPKSEVDKKDEVKSKNISNPTSKEESKKKDGAGKEEIKKEQERGNDETFFEKIKRKFPITTKAVGILATLGIGYFLFSKNESSGAGSNNNDRLARIDLVSNSITRARVVSESPLSLQERFQNMKEYYSFLSDECEADQADSTEKKQSPPPSRTLMLSQHSKLDPQKLQEHSAVADRWDAKKQYALGAEYSKKGDYANALVWFRKAVFKGGVPEAHYSLGQCYLQGKGLKEDYYKAKDHFEVAAKAGFSAAQYYLATLYQNGQGVEKNDTTAAEWYQKAADQGNAQAQVNLGVCYANGTGVARNTTRAVEWFKKAAQHGNPEAQFNLGLCHAVGVGVEQNDDEAALWFGNAAKQGHARAKAKLDELQAKSRAVKNKV